MEKYLYIAENGSNADAATDGVMYPLSRLSLVERVGANSVKLHFETMVSGNIDNTDDITVSFSSNFTIKQFCDGLANLFRKGKNKQFINICDSDNLTDMFTSTTCAGGGIVLDS